MKTYSRKKFRRAQAAMALAIFVFPTLCFSQGLKFDLLDGSDCRLFCDSTKRGLRLGQESVSWLPAPPALRQSFAIDHENGLLSSQSYYLSESELNENGQYRLFGLSDAAMQRSEFRGRSDWEGTKKASLGKSAAGKTGKGLLNVDIPVKFPKALSSLVGEGGPGIAVTGNYKVIFKLDKNSTSGVANIGQNRQGVPGFQTQQEYNMYINGNVGSKLFVSMKTDKRANVYNQRLDLADRIQIRYKGNDEDLVQSIEAGNTNLSLGGTRYAGFSQSVQGLFGIKAQGKLGGFAWTGIASQQKGNSQSKTFRAGADAATIRRRDKDYLRYTYFDLGQKRVAKPNIGPDTMPAFIDEFIPGRHVLEELLVFKSVPSQQSGQITYPSGTCYVNPLDTTRYPLEKASGFFEYLSPERQQYEVNRDSFYIRFNYPVNSGDVIGVVMRVLDLRDSSRVQIGYSYGDTSDIRNLKYVLKLIKHSTPNNDQNVTFYYEWKNVYDMQERNINPDGFSVNIYEGRANTESDPNRRDFPENNAGVKYLRLLGLDQVQNNTGERYGPTSAPDNKIDLNQTVVDVLRGHLIFPDRYPFNPTANYVGDSSGVLSPRVPTIYTESTTVAGNASQYFIEISTKSRRTEFSLGQVDITEGSEDVRLNGRKLIRDEDYRIDYQLGTISFYNSQVADPNADVQINYEYTPFLSAQKKNLFGWRGEYAPSEALKLGSTVLYRSASTIDQKPRIGEEPNQALLLDADFSYTGQSGLLTKLVDKLPGVATAAPSAFQLEGEVARSLPNPNTLGKAYIDDFEGSRDFLGLGIRRTIWIKSSAPTPAGKNQTNRGRLAWYVPDGKITNPRYTDPNVRAVERFRVLEIFPERSVPSREEPTDVLELRYFPKRDSAGLVDTTSWGGIMRWLSAGLQDHQETRLLEFWVGLEDSTLAPKLHFDFGQISEDINGDGRLQTEDPLRRKVIEPSQDVGLNGLTDQQEADSGLSTDEDNWDTDIDHINGTEENRNDPERLSRPDAEDLNDDTQLLGQSSYFSFVLDLNDTTKFMVPGSYRRNDYDRNPNTIDKRPGESRLIYWRQIRLPLKDTSVVDTIIGSPTWSNIEYVRLWLEGADTARIIFANLEMVGNRWKELGVFDDSLRPVTTGNQRVRVAVKNSQEHPDYSSPPGVSEVLNRVTNLFEREQSLVIAYENLRPGRPERSGEVAPAKQAPGPGERSTGDQPARGGDQALVQRVLLGGAEDYSGYRTLKMFVHGDLRMVQRGDALSDSLMFFLRFGSGTQNDPNNFYEYRVLLKPDWDLANLVTLDFNRLTSLKNVLQKSRRDAGIATGVGDTTDGNYRVRGNPSLAAVRWYVAGVQNLDTVRTASGEVWMDELLLSDVRRDAGTAGRFHLNTQLSDFGTVTFEASRQGATFRNLTGGESGTLSYNRSAATTELLSFSGSFQGHKLMPKFLGFSALPISISWSRSRSTPRLRTGSDIVLTDEFAVAERTEQLRRGFSVNPSLKRETKNWLWNLTFNRMSGGFSYSYLRNSDPYIYRTEQRGYTASLNYDLSPRKALGFKPFGWLPSFWLLKKLENSSFSPLPASFNLSGDVARTQTVTILNDARRSRSGSYVRDFRGRLASGFRFFPNLTADYDFNTRRDISDPKNLVFSASPKKFRLGLEVDRGQDFKTSYNPGLFRFADARFTFNSAYHEAGGFSASTDGTRRVEANSGYGVSVNFSLTRFLGPPRAPSPEEVVKKQLEQKEKEEERRKKEEEKLGKKPDSARLSQPPQIEAATALPDTTPAETRFRRSLELFLPVPYPGLGFLVPRLVLPVLPDSALKTPGDPPAARGGADSSGRAQVPADSIRKSAPPPVKPSGRGGVFLLSGGVDWLRKLAFRIDPLQFNYNHGERISQQGLRNRPGLAFQFGLSNRLQGGRRGPSDSRSNSDNYSLGSGFNFGSGLRMNARYAKNIAKGFLSSGTTRQETEIFPDLAFTLSGLEQRMGILKKFLPMGSVSSNYQRQTATAYDAATGRANTINTTKSYSPLVSTSFTFFRGLSASFSYRTSTQTSKSRDGLRNSFIVSETKENGFSVSSRYSFIAPRGIRLPLLHGIRLSSSLTTNLGLQYSHRVTRNPNALSGPEGVTYDVSSLGITPSMTYSFSTQVDGGLSIQWTDQKDNIAKRTTKVRSAVFSVDLKF